MRLLISVLILFVIALAGQDCTAAPPGPPGSLPSLVAPENTIGDFDTRLALARVLSYGEETLDESLREYDILLAEQPENQALRLERAEIAIRLKRYEEALQHIALVLQKRPKDFAALRSMGDICFYTNRLKEAIDYYRRALAVNSASPETERRLALALSWDGRDTEAFPALSTIHERFPDDREVTVELARLNARKKDYGRALSLLRPLLLKHPADPVLLQEMGDVEASLGHAAKCRYFYLEAIKLSKGDEKVLLKYAGLSGLWGNFDGAAKIYRDYIKAHPPATGTVAALAKVLVSAERYEEAEGLYRMLLLKNPGMVEALLGLTRLKVLEKDFHSSLKWAGEVLKREPAQVDALFLKAESLFFLKRYDEALRIYLAVAETGTTRYVRSGALVEAGRVYRKLGEDRRAEECFGKALSVTPESISARFCLAGNKGAATGAFIDARLREERGSPARLTEWAGEYAEQGQNREAILFYEAALKQDREYFPASMGLAQAYAGAREYGKALGLLASLNAALPDTSKILTWRARVLSWSGRYVKSIDTYETVERLDPSDPVPKKEKARVAVWGKMMDKAGTFYREMSTPAVDGQLLAALPPATDGEDRCIARASGNLSARVKGGSTYEGYEEFSRAFGSCRQTLPAGERTRLETLLLTLLPVYRIQKQATLEGRSKTLAWHKRFARAAGSYEELLSASPGNEEALFDYAQVKCSLGLCRDEGRAYEALNDIDPRHSLGSLALMRQRMRSNPSLKFDYSYWMEDGRGDLSRITRNRFDLSLNVPLFCQYFAGITVHRWLERPWYNHRTYGADGYSLFAGGVINAYMKAEARWTHKKYANSDLSPRDSGYALLWFNLKDYVHLGAGYERADEIYNYFGIAQGTQSDSWWAGLRSDITRRLEVNGRARFITYNDSNSGQHHMLSAGYGVTDHPRVFKVILSGEFRDTRKENVNVYYGNTLVDIVHPYWTPKDYLGTTVTFEWRHDYSPPFFCGSRVGFYDVKVSFGTDTENNPSARVEVEWNHEFYDRWLAGIKGMWHTSPQWDARGLWAFLRYRF